MKPVHLILVIALLVVGICLLAVSPRLGTAPSVSPPSQQVERPQIERAPPERSDPQVGTVKTFTVPATNPGFDTGIDVTGKEIIIKVTGGRWSNSPGVDAIFSDGEGSGSWPGLVYPEATFRALIGKTDTRIFKVGNLFEGKAGTGRLRLFMNDTFAGGGYGDNQGELTVTVSTMQ